MARSTFSVLVSTVLFTLLPFYSYSQECTDWITNTISTNPVTSHEVLTDADGNIYQLIRIQGSGTITGKEGSFSYIENYYSEEGMTLVLIKYDPDGIILWSMPFHTDGSTGWDQGLIEHQGTIYLAGNFEGKVLIDGVEFESHPDSYFFSSFIIKMDSEGAIDWVKILSSPFSRVHSHELAFDQNGQLLLSGYFTGEWTVAPGITIGSIPAGIVYVGWYSFALKMDTDGNVIWAVANHHDPDDTETVAWSEGFTISSDLNNDVIWAGCYTDTTFFGEQKVIPLEEHAIQPFIAKLDGESGTVLWAHGHQAEDGLAWSEFSAIAVDQDNNIYAAGILDGITYIDGELYEIGPGTGIGDAILQKFDPEGNTLFVKKIGGAGEDYETMSSVDILPSGLVNCTAVLTNNFHTDIGPTPTYGATSDAIWMEMDQDGTVLEVQKFGGTGYETASAVTYDTDGNIILTSITNSNTYFFGEASIDESDPNIYNLILGKRCRSLTDLTQVETPGTGALSPNPTSGIVYLPFKSAQPLSIAVRNALGHEVETIQLDGINPGQALNLEHLPAGWYSLSVQEKERTPTSYSFIIAK